MRNSIGRRSLLAVAVSAILLLPATGFAQSPQILDPTTRYMALGDSLAAGYRAVPVTDGYTYLLYKDGVFDGVPRTAFCNAAVPGATSDDVLAYQVPQVHLFAPDYITLSVGGNDLLTLLGPALQGQDITPLVPGVISHFGSNLAQILGTLHATFPNAKIFVANTYALPAIQQIIPATDDVVNALNNAVAQVVGLFPTNVYLVDVHSAFLGRNNLLFADRHGVSFIEVHPTTVGYRVMEKAFADVILANK